jgi:hypothetical protein
MSQNVTPRTHPMLFILTGLFAGALLGFGIALFLQNRDINPMVPFLSNRNDTLEIDQKEHHQKNQTGKPVSESTAGDTTAEPEDTVIADTSSSTDDEYSPASSEDSLYTPVAGTGDLVLRDELIGSRRIRVQWDEDRPQKGNERSDSLLTGLTSVKPPEGLFQEYTVEFWRNPLNYKGYRISRDKLVIFGLSPDQPCQLRYTTGQLVLITGKQQYLLRESNTFIPLIPKK